MPLTARLLGACAIRSVSPGSVGDGSQSSRTSAGGTTSYSGQRPRGARRRGQVAADDHGAGVAQVRDLGGVAAPQVGAPRLEDDSLPACLQQRQRHPARRERQAGVEVEDVEVAHRPAERPQLLRQVERDRAELARVAQLEVDVEAALERPLVEDEQRALDAELAQPGRDRARPARDVDRRVKDFQATGVFGGDLDLERGERLLGERVELVLVARAQQQVAEPLGAGGHRRQRHSLAPVPAGLVDAVERERRGRVEPDDAARLRDDEAHLADRRGRLAGLQVVAGQLAERPEHVRADGVEAGHELRQLGVLAAAEPRADLDRPGLAVAHPHLDVRRPGLEPDREARLVRELEQRLLVLQQRRVAVRDADAERRRRVQQPPGDAHREVLALEQEAVDRELVAVEVLLEHQRAGARGGERAVDRVGELALGAHLGHPALGGAVHRLDDDRRAELVEGLLGLLEARRLAALRAAHLALLEGRAHAALVGDRAGGLDRQARQAEPLGQLRGGEDGLVGAHRRDRDRLDPLRLELAEHAADVGEAPDDPVVGLREQRRVGRAVDDADLVPERARLLEQPELRA